MSTTKEDFKKSFQDFKALLTTEYDLESYPLSVIKGKTFGTKFPNALIFKPTYEDCKFIGTNFEGTNLANSKFHICSFIDCLFNNCDLRYWKLYRSHFQNGKISGCGFGFGIFKDITFESTTFEGCSFGQMQLENISIQGCKLKFSSFEQSDIKNCVLKDLDLRQAEVRYCNFEGTTFENVVFHILDLPRNYGLVEQLLKSPNTVYVAYKGDKLMPLEEAVAYLRKLVPYYYETHQFYELLTTYALHKEYDKVKEVMPEVLKSLIDSCDFSALQDICTLIVKMELYNEEELNTIYSQIQHQTNKDKSEKSSQYFIANIKNILAGTVSKEI